MEEAESASTVAEAMRDSDLPLVIHHIEGRRSLRVVWLCEELGLPYSLIYQRGDVLGSMVTIRKIQPLMPMAPTVRFGDTLIVESGAIIDVLLARYGEGRMAPPVRSPDFPLHTQWMHFAEGSAMSRIAITQATPQASSTTPGEVNKGYRRGVPIDEPVVIGPVGLFEYIEEHLQQYPYFGGSEFSAADIMMHWAVRFARLWAWIYIEDHPAVARWFADVEARPAFARATAAATPDGTNIYGLPVADPLPPFWPEPPQR